MLKKKIVLVFLTILIVLSTFFIPVSAASDYVKIKYTQPLADHLNGYAEVFYNVDNELYCYVYYWRIVNLSTTYTTESGGVSYENLTSYMNLNFDSSSSKFTWTYGFPNVFIGNDEQYPQFHLVTGWFNGTGTDCSQKLTFCNGLSELEQSISGTMNFPGARTPSRVRIFGNGVWKGATSYTNNCTYSTIYGADTLILNQLQALEKAYSGIGTDITDNADKNAEEIQSNADKNAEEIQSNADKNAEEIQSNADKNAEKIQANQNANTDKQIAADKQLQEDEKNEAETQGQGSVDEIGSAIEDKSAGFISAIGSLVNSMSYNGTSCAWSFPALKLPAINGVMPEYQLTQEQPIDFEFWVNKIPSDILLLVRSLFTIALIVYCFKELYSTISYVLTLKGGGNSE